MKKQEFMSRLEAALGDVSPENRNEIMYDYQEHFAIGLGEGKSEDEISADLGDPVFIARQYNVERLIRHAETNKSPRNVMKAVMAALSLGFLNLIFVIPLFFGLVGVLIGLYGAAIGITVGGLGLFLASIIGPVFPQWVSMPSTSTGIMVFVSFGLMSGGALFTILDIYISRFFYKLTIRYIRANINTIRR
ncbi:MAG: DUF1700 domain-containing protein [Clostridiales bacterium]|nr:DUF1700 domain-containing protein [Clostridiales bacterium]